MFDIGAYMFSKKPAADLLTLSHIKTLSQASAADDF